MRPLTVAMMTVDHGWRKPRIEHSTRTWRPATQIVRVRDLQVTVIADDTAAFDAHWPVLDLDCGDAFSIDTLAAGRSATVHARVCDQSRRVNGTHGTIGRGVALAQPMVNSRGAAEPIPPGTRLLGFAIVAKAPVCDEPTRLEIEAWLREHDIGSGNYGSMEVGSTYLFVDAERSPAWLVNTPSFIEDHRFGPKPVSNLRFVYNASDPTAFSAYFVAKKPLRMGSLLWWCYGAKTINADIKEAIAARKERTPVKALIAKRAKKDTMAARSAAMLAAKRAKLKA